MLLQGSYFSAVDLAEIARHLDERENSMLQTNHDSSSNMDDSGFFSVQVSFGGDFCTPLNLMFEINIWLCLQQTSFLLGTED